MAFSLYSILTEEDKTILKNYISLYGIREESFIGLEEWLKYWSKNKIKLYKLLGENLIYKIPYSYEEPVESLENKFENIVYNTEHEVLFNRVKTVLFNQIPSNLIYVARKGLISSTTYANNSIPENIVLDFKNDKKKVVLSKGMKPVKGLLKFLKYFNIYEELKDEYEKFRLAHSRIFNNRTIKGNLVISIHPMDFITMSDNASKWISCMNWTQGDGGGCYKVGTVEMMNSNCVVCCYLESINEPYIFKKDSKDGDNNDFYKWNNKKWRQLFYVTKDIIVEGKSYPYESKELSEKLLSLLQELSKENLNIKYSFGPEKYMDMTGVYSSEDFETAKENIHNRHRILFDTKGMYNDMVNDHSLSLNCVRNKVKRNKIINISGKCPCLHCGDQIIERAFYDDDYNERYSYVENLACVNCMENFFTCSECSSGFPNTKFYEVNGKKYCDKCVTRFRKCPCGCDTVFNISERDLEDSHNICTFTEKDIYSYLSLRRAIIHGSFDSSKNMIKVHGFCPLYMCEDELERRIASGDIVKASKILKFKNKETLFYWESKEMIDYYITKEPYDRIGDMQKFLSENVEIAYPKED
jgi:hypothetical protein